ncbi:MAG: aromatic ring-hydroxylating dioxygenase subunit alpha [Bacteroidota bacterium]
MLNLPKIDADISLAHTLPGDFYLDKNVFEWQKQHLFPKSWQYVAPATELKANNSTYPFELCGEPLVLTRDKNGELHCLSNVCTHRGNLLVTEKGAARMLSCNYHGRCFNLDGQFRSMPGFEGVKNFPSEKDHLHPCPVMEWGGMIFAATAFNGSFEDHFAPMMDRLSWMPLEDMVFYPSKSRAYTFPANWMLYCDNYLEGFHIPFVHPALNAALDNDLYGYELFHSGNLQLGIAKENEPIYDIPASSPDHGKLVYAYYYWMYPNLMFNFYPWGLSLNVVEPLGIAETRVHFLTFLYPEKEEEFAEARIHQTEMEDEAVVLGVQKGISSKFYTDGRYSVSMEQGVHHFHRLLIGGMIQEF